MADLAKIPSAALSPARVIRDVPRSCDEERPLGSDDARWQDFSAARGDQATIELHRELTWRPADRFVHAVFVGHRGAGKSTEILRLTERLSETYHRVYLEATVEMDPHEIESEDLLLNLAFAIEASMRKRGTPLPDELLGRVRKWFDEVVSHTDWARNFSMEAAAGIEGKASIPFVGSLFGHLKALFKYESKYRMEVKQVLRKYPGALLQSVNDLFDEATKLLGSKALLVVIDNLDRYEPKIIDQLLVAGADRMRQLRTNLILTPPVSLLLRPQSGQLDHIYSCYSLYAVRLRSPSARYDEFDGPGRDLMEQALARRIDLDVILPERGARDLLIAASGGAIRELLHLLNRAAYGAEGEVITEEDVERAIRHRKQRLRDMINANGWLPALLKIAETKQIFPDEACLEVLFHYLAFKYNGEGWYDVHPLVAELPEFVDGLRQTDR